MTARPDRDDQTSHAPSADGSALEHELRVASDSFLARVERMHALEQRKRELPADDIAELAQEIQALAEEVLGWARQQSRLAETAADAGLDDLRPIAVVPPRALNEVLSEWRAAERLLQTVEPGSAAYETARADSERLRDEYARAYRLHSKGLDEGA
jgi:erythromycin esterase-like protein